MGAQERGRGSSVAVRRRHVDHTKRSCTNESVVQIQVRQTADVHIPEFLRVENVSPRQTLPEWRRSGSRALQRADRAARPSLQVVDVDDVAGHIAAVTQRAIALVVILTVTE